MAAQIEGLGKTTVVVAGTPVILSIPAAIATLLSGTNVHAVVFQVLSGNTGAVYIGKVGMNKTTLAGVIMKLPPPTTNQYPTFSAAITVAANAIPLVGFVIDADVSGEGISASVMVV